MEKSRHLPRQDGDQTHACQRREGKDSERRAQDSAASKAVAGRIVLRYEFGYSGLNSEVEQADISAELQDKHPCAVFRGGQVTHQEWGKCDTNKRREKYSDEI